MPRKIVINGFETLKGLRLHHPSNRMIECTDAKVPVGLGYYQLYFNLSGHDNAIDVTLHTTEGNFFISSWKDGEHSAGKIKRSDLKNKNTFLKAVADMLIKQGY